MEELFEQLIFLIMTGSNTPQFGSIRRWIIQPEQMERWGVKFTGKIVITFELQPPTFEQVAFGQLDDVGGVGEYK
jgi:hypothetical protein